MKLDFGLQATYTVKAINQASAECLHLPTFYAHPFTNEPQKDTYDTFLHLTHRNGVSWIAAMTGDLANPAVEGVHATPSETHCLTIVDSTAFLINTAQPGNIQFIGDCIQKVEKYLMFELILLLDFAAITAIGKEGLLWQTPRLVQDGISILNINDKEISGVGDFSRSQDTPDSFKVCTRSGKVIQGNLFTESN